MSEETKLAKVKSNNDLLKVSIILIVIGFAIVSGFSYLKYTLDLENMQLKLALSIRLAEVNTDEAKNLMCEYARSGLETSKKIEVKIFQKFDNINFEEKWNEIEKVVCYGK